jgi:outer membrane protein assembly factor BamB
MLTLAACVLALQPPAEPEPAPRTPAVRWHVPLHSTSFGGAAAADCDGDGLPDIAFGTYFGDGRVHVLRGKDGKELWSYDAGKACLDASCRFYDLDGDGRLELVIPVSNLSQVLAFDAATGQRLWKTELGPGECTDTPPWIGVIDGRLGIMVGTFEGNVHLLDGRDGKVARTLHVAPGAVQSCPIVMDLNGDGTMDVVAANFNGDKSVHAVDGRTGTDLWALRTGGAIYHGPSAGDLDGDGAPDLVIGSYDGRVYAVHAADGKELWTADPGERYIMSPTAILDADGDGAPDVAVASEKITVLRGATGEVLWKAGVDETGGFDVVTRGVSVADLDGDGAPDLAYATAMGTFVVRRARDGEVIYQLDVAKAINLKAEHDSHGPTIADFDGDGRLDVFLVVGYPGRSGAGAVGEAVCLTGFAGAGGRGSGWTMLRHDPQNTGNVATPVK